MTRNTIKRVEVAAPITDTKLKERILKMFDVMLSDNVKARILENDGTYSKQSPDPSEPLINSQEFFYDEAYKLANAKKLRSERAKAKSSSAANKTSKPKRSVTKKTVKK